MTTNSPQPFSARNRREKNWIEEEFPDSARTGLLHLLKEAIDEYYIPGWPEVANEVRRIARANIQDYDKRSVQSLKDARHDADVYLGAIGWERAYDFCERIYSHLAQGTAFQEEGGVVIITKEQSKLFLAEEIQRLFEEENLAYEFRDGLVQRRGKRHTVDQIGKAENAMANMKLQGARKHFSKALHHFRHREKPDYENAVKEAVCAVEAAAKELFPEAKAATLGDFGKWATAGSEPNLLPKTIGKTFEGLYGYRGSAEGVSHGATSGGAVTAALTEYVLGVTASQIILLIDLMSDDDEPPF